MEDEPLKPTEKTATYFISEKKFKKAFGLKGRVDYITFSMGSLEVKIIVEVHGEDITKDEGKEGEE